MSVISSKINRRVRRGRAPAVMIAIILVRLLLNGVLMLLLEMPLLLQLLNMLVLYVLLMHFLYMLLELNCVGILLLLEVLL